MKTLITAAYLLLAACLAFPAGAQNLLSPEEFADAYIEELHARAPGYKVRRVGRLHLEVSVSEETGFTVFLDNAYKNYRNSPESENEIIAEQVAAILESLSDETDAVDLSRIIPVIKDVDYLREVELSLRERGEVAEPWVPPAHEPYNEELVILYAEDTDLNIRYLNEEVLKDNGFTTSGRRETAVQNLRSLLPEIEAHGDDGLYMLTAGGTYESSLLLFDDIWQSGQLEVQGEIVVAVPARDLLLVTGSKDHEGLEFLRKAVSDAMETSPYSLTDRLFVYRNGRFQPFGG